RVLGLDGRARGPCRRPPAPPGVPPNEGLVTLHQAPRRVHDTEAEAEGEDAAKGSRAEAGDRIREPRQQPRHRQDDVRGEIADPLRQSYGRISTSAGLLAWFPKRTRTSAEPTGTTSGISTLT